MDRCLVVQIMSDRLQGSIHLTQCLLCSDEISLPQKFLFVLFPCDAWKQFALIVGATVNIYPPWYVEQFRLCCNFSCNWRLLALKCTPF